MFCVLGLGVCGAESWAWVWAVAEQDVGDDGGDIGVDAAGTCVCAIFAGGFPDGGAWCAGYGSDYVYCCDEFFAARGATAVGEACRG